MQCLFIATRVAKEKKLLDFNLRFFYANGYFAKIKFVVGASCSLGRLLGSETLPLQKNKFTSAGMFPLSFEFELIRHTIN